MQPAVDPRTGSVSASYVAPRGRKGLWEALARATSGSVAVAVEDVDEGPELVAVEEGADRALLGYLARLAGPPAPTPDPEPAAGADVIDLAAFRARRA